jgi:predicted dehydrogenase
MTDIDVHERTTTTDTYQSRPVRIGILGAGGIATVDYGVLPNLHHIAEKVDVVAIADIDEDRARAAAGRFGVAESYGSLSEMLASADIDAVINLTIIPAHASTSLEILESGRHLVVEKPIATTMAEADDIIALATEKGLTAVVAPPDMLYPPFAEAARLVRAGTIGDVAFARVRSSNAGPGGGAEGWPSDPSWFYREGSGPMYDMGVYGIHQITGILGPAKRVTAFSGVTEPTRILRGGPFAGKEMPVTVDDNSLFMLDFGGSSYAVIDGTFNVHTARSPRMELFGRKGAMNVYHPIDRFRASEHDLEVYRTDALPGVDGWVVPDYWPQLDATRTKNLQRALLVDHLVDVLRGGTPVMTAEHARHALEIMIAVTTSAREGRVVDLTTTF